MYNSCRSEKFGSNRGQICIGVWLTEDHWTDNDWVGNLRMSKVTFQKLCEELAPFIERRDTNYRKAISLRERVAITLYRLADTASYRTVSNLFGVGKSTVCQIVLEVCTCIVEVLFKRLCSFRLVRIAIFL